MFPASKLLQNFHKGKGSEHEDYYLTVKKLVRNSEFSESDGFKELSVLDHEFLVSHKKICLIVKGISPGIGIMLHYESLIVW